MSKTGFILVPTEAVEGRLPQLTDRWMAIPAGTDNLEGILFTSEEVIDFFNEQLDSRVARGSIEIEDCSRELINLIIYGNIQGIATPARTPALTGTTTPPTATTETSQLPAGQTGIMNPDDTSEEEIVIESTTTRITPPVMMSKPVKFHPSQLLGFYLIERDRALLANWEFPEDDGGSPILNFEVAIIPVEDNTGDISALNWINVMLNTSYLFENLPNNVRHDVYGRARNAVGYSFTVFKTAAPVEGQSKPLTLQISAEAAYYIHAAYTNGFSEVKFNLRYSEEVTTLDINQVTPEGGTITSHSGSNNYFSVVVKPNSYTTPVKLTVSPQAAVTSLNKRTAADVVSPAVPFRATISNVPQPLKPQLVPKDKALLLMWQEPETSLSGYEKLTGYQVSDDEINWIDKTLQQLAHEFAGLTNGIEIPVYLRSKSLTGYSPTLTLRATPIVDVEIIDVPEEELPEIPRNAGSFIDTSGTLYYRWEAPLKDNFDGFEYRVNGGSTVRLAKDVREYIHSSSERWVIVEFELRTYNSRGFSPWLEYANEIPAFPDPLENANAEGGNGVVKITFDPLPDTPLDNESDPDGLLVYSSPQYAYCKITKNGVEILNVDSIGSPSYFQLENGVAHTVEVGSRTIHFVSDVVHSFEITPSDSHAAMGDIDAVTLTLTPAANAIGASWVAPTNNGGGAGIAYYEAEISPRPAIVDVTDPDTQLKYLYQPFRVDGTSFNFSELYADTEYTIRVRPVHENGTFGQLLEHPPITRYVYGAWAEATASTPA